MPAPKMGRDGHRRLTVTFVLVDDDADRLYALATARDGSAQHTSRFAAGLLRDVLVYQASDEDVAAMIRALRRARTGADRPSLRLVPKSALPD